MSWQATGWAKKLSVCPNGGRITGSEKFVLMMLSECHNPHTRLCEVSITELAEDALRSRRHTMRLLQSLESKGVIQGQRSAGTTTVYILCHPNLLPVTRRHQSGGDSTGDMVSPVPDVTSDTHVTGGGDTRVTSGGDVTSPVIHTHNTLKTLKTLKKESGAQAPVPVDKSKKGSELDPRIKEQTDLLYYSDSDRFKTLIQWVRKTISKGFAPVDIATTLAGLWAREQKLGPVYDWWAYLEGDRDTNQTMIQRVRTKRLQGESSEHKKGDAAESLKAIFERSGRTDEQQEG